MYAVTRQTNSGNAERMMMPQAWSAAGSEVHRT